MDSELTHKDHLQSCNALQKGHPEQILKKVDSGDRQDSIVLDMDELTLQASRLCQFRIHQSSQRFPKRDVVKLQEEMHRLSNRQHCNKILSYICWDHWSLLALTGFWGFGVLGYEY